MAKPAAPLSWSTDTNFSAGPETGTPTKEDPAGVASQGWTAGRAAPAKWMNWVLNRLGAWTSYLDDLHNDADFLGQQYVWTNYHQFDTGPTFNGGQFIGPTVFTVGADVVFESTNFQVDAVNVLFAGLRSTNTIALANISNEILYTDGAGVSSPRARTELVNLASGQISGNPTGIVASVLVSLSAPSYWTWPTTSGQVTFPLKFPRGAGISSIRVGASNQSGGSATVTCTLMGKGANKVTPSATSAAALDVDSLSLASSADHIFTLIPSVPVTVDNSVAEYFLIIDGQVDCRIHWIEINYTDPGPRNG